MAAQKETRVVELIINGKQAELSLNQIKGKVIQLTKELSRMKEADDPILYKQKAAELQKVNAAYKEMRAGITGATTATSKFWSGMKQMAGGVAIGNMLTASFAAVVKVLSSVLTNTMELSDQYADVAKTTGLTIGEVEKLRERLDTLNTRTARKELLELARDAGKLGIQGSENIYQFVAAADKINVALGDDLGEDAIKNIGKLVNVFRLDEQFGLETSMLKVGSAINELGMASTANEGYMVDFLKRMGGIAPLAKITAADSLALGATLDSLGQTSEVSSTALSKLFVNMAKDARTYAGIAGVSVDEFATTMNNNALEALIMVLKAAGKTKGGIIQLTNTLGDLGIEGGRATGIFGALANNVDKLEGQMKVSNAAFEKGSSITDEFNTKNNTLAGSYDKLKKKMSNLFLSSTSGLGTFLGNIIIKTNEWTDSNEKSSTAMEKTQVAFNSALETYKNGNFTQEQRVRLMNEINTEYADYLPQLLTEKDSLSEINKKQEEGNKLIYQKILLQRFQKERQAIVEKQLDAEDELYQREKKRMELAMDQSTGFSPNQKKQLMDGMAAVDNFNKTTIKGTAAQLTELDNKFTALAANAGLAWSKIVNSTGVKPNLIIDGDLPAEKEKKEKKGPRVKTEAELAKEEFKKALEYLEEYIQKRKNELSASYLNGEIDHETYNEKLKDLDMQFYESKVALEEEHKQSSVETENEILSAKIKIKEEELAAHQRTLEELDALSDEFDKKERERIKAQKDYAIDVANSVVDVIGAIRQHRTTTELQAIDAEGIAFEKKQDKEKASLKKQLASELISQEKYDAALAALEEEATAKQKELRKKQFYVEQESALAMARINLVRMVGQALVTPPGPPATIPFGIAAAIMGGLQIAQITNTPVPNFYGGGVTVTGAMDGRSYNASNTGSFVNGGRVNSAQVGLIGERGPELVIPNWLYTAPQSANVMRALEAAIYSKQVVTPQFAEGGNTSFFKGSGRGVARIVPGQLGSVLRDEMLGNAIIDIKDTLALLNERLSNPIEAKTLYNKQDYDDYVKDDTRARSAGKF